MPNLLDIERFAASHAWAWITVGALSSLILALLMWALA